MKLKTITALLFLTLLVSFTTNAQKTNNPFKGVITYKITYPELNVNPAQQTSMPQTMKLYLDGNKARAELLMADMTQVLIMDSDAKTTVILLDIMDKKVAMKPNKQNKPLGKEPIVEPANESKEIAGYVCKKANIHYGDEKSKSNPIEVYYSDEVGNNKIFYDNEYRNLTGIPLEFRYKMQGMNMLLTATSVEKGRVSNRQFEVPSEYKETTPEQLRQLFGGGM